MSYLDQKLAIWNTPAAEFVLAGTRDDGFEVPYGIERGSPRDCEEMLGVGAVDIALLPPVRALQHTDAYDVLAAVAFSSWEYPYARLVLKNGLRGPTRTVACHPNDVQEALVARVILKEHYDQEPELVARAVEPGAMLQAEEDAVLLSGPEVPSMATDDLTLDLGREWYELTNYPMVWGLFATRKDEGTPEMIREMRSIVEAAEEQRNEWIQEQEIPAELHSFYADALRLRLDRLAIASLTELRHYLFYYDLTDEVSEVPFIYLPDDEENEDEILI